jgi:hypothetical protein
MPSSSIATPLIIGSVAAAVGAILYLMWPKDFGLRLSVVRQHLPRSGGAPAGAGLASYLRLPHPIFVALVQAIPLGIASFYISAPNLWLFYFVLCSVMSGASASRAAGRVRPLWLLLPGSRAELYRQVERTFWRYNAYAISMLVVLLTVLGSVRDLGAGLLAIGIPLLLIGFALGLYLGLMTTGRLRILDAILATTSTALMLRLAYDADQASGAFVVGSLSVLAVAALAFRQMSRHRWRVIDWADNRPARI